MFSSCKLLNIPKKIVHLLRGGGLQPLTWGYVHGERRKEMKEYNDEPNVIYVLNQEVGRMSCCRLRLCGCAGVRFCSSAVLQFCGCAVLQLQVEVVVD